jgi:hypothetical protein
VWVPPLILKFFIFLVFAFVLFEVTVGLADRDLPANRVWIIVAGFADDQFDPQALMADWESPEPQWNVAREW